MFGGLYENLGTKRTSQFCFNVVFLIRRLTYALCIGTIFTSITLLSILFQIFFSMTLCVYVLASMPFEEKKDNYIELMNEMTILVVFYLCLGLITDDTIMSGQMRSHYGILMIIFIFINIVINFVIFVHGILVFLKSRIRQYFAKKLRQKTE